MLEDCKSGSILEHARTYASWCFERRLAPRASELAHSLGLSPCQLNRAFVRETEMTPSDFLKSEQIRLAKLLLQDTHLAMCEVAARSGFTQPRTFFRAFRRVAGVSPSDHRRTARTLQTVSEGKRP